MLGRKILDLAPTKGNPRNSEGAFIELSDGSILFAYSKYVGEDGDDGAPADIYGILSQDGGDTFGEPFPMISHKERNAQNLMSVSLIRLQDGAIGMSFLQKNEGYQCHPYFLRSYDEGKTWSEPVNIIEEPGYFIVNNDRFIRLTSGKLMFVAAYMRVQIRETADNKTFKQGASLLPGEVWTYVSADDGRTWERASVLPYIYLDKPFTKAGWQEPGVVQQADGRVRLVIRTDLGRIYDSYSSDEGKTWSVPGPTMFTAPNSPITVKPLSNGKMFFVWNPVPNYVGSSQMADGVWTGGRTPLVVTVQDENAPFLHRPVAVETDEKSGFAYTAVYETVNGDVLLGYCAGGVPDGGMLNRLRITKITKAEIDAIS